MRFLTSFQSIVTALLVALVGLPLSGNAQMPRPPGPWFQTVYHTGVEKGMREMSAPFAGGLSSPQFSQADLNKDGLLDLVIYDGYVPELSAVRTFINKGTAGSPKYVYTPHYAYNFINVQGALRYPNQISDVYSYIMLLDYNCDGIPDLFTGGYPGVKVSKGAYNSRNELYFTFYKALYYPSAFGPLNVYVAGSDLPGIADVDGDGDIDFVTYATAGSVMEYYRNQRVERGLSCDSIQLELETSCWGRARQGIDRTLYTHLNANCQLQGPPLWDPGTTPMPGGYNSEPWASAAKTTAHGSNTLCLIDIDGDGDQDILNSSESNDDMQLQINGRKGLEPGRIDTIVAQDTLWQTGGRRAALRTFPAAFLIDYDADGKKDILVAPHFETQSSLDQNQVWWYRNTSTTSVPNFQFQSDSVLSEDIIDGGSNSHPLYYDFNKDGRIDILIGATSTRPNGSRYNKLLYYENVTTSKGNPRYRFITDNLAGIDALPALGVAPAVGDIDGDGIDDLLIGLESGQFAFYKNNAASNTIPPVWQLAQSVLMNPDATEVRVTGYAAPFIYDINRDGRPDVLSGSNTGRLAAFLNNTAVPGVPAFSAKKDSLGKALIDSTFGTRISTPFVGRLDSTAQLYLLMGSNSGALGAWKITDSTALTAVYERANGNLPVLKSPGRSAPAVADMDGDGRLELILGSKWGGLHMYWSGPPPAGISPVEIAQQVPVILFPNPAADRLNVRRQGSKREVLQLTIRNLMGQVLLSKNMPAGNDEIYFETADIPVGTYLLSVQSTRDIWSSKVQILR